MAKKIPKSILMTLGLVIIAGANIQLFSSAVASQQSPLSRQTLTGPANGQPGEPYRRQRVHGRRLVDEVAQPAADGQSIPPGQEIELIDVGYDPPSFVIDASRDVLSNLADNAYIAIVAVDAIDSTLSSDATWVHTVVTARVVETLRTDTTLASEYPAGAVIHFEWFGGDIAVDGHRVIATTSGVSRVQKNQQYVVFAGLVARQLIVFPQGLHELSHGVLKSALRTLPADRSTDGKLLSDLRKAAKAAERRR